MTSMRDEIVISASEFTLNSQVEIRSPDTGELSLCQRDDLIYLGPDQIAALWPALRASAIPPAVAARGA